MGKTMGNVNIQAVYEYAEKQKSLAVLRELDNVKAEILMMGNWRSTSEISNAQLKQVAEFIEERMKGYDE